MWGESVAVGLPPNQMDKVFMEQRLDFEGSVAMLSYSKTVIALSSAFISVFGALHALLQDTHPNLLTASADQHRSAYISPFGVNDAW